MSDEQNRGGSRGKKLKKGRSSKSFYQNGLYFFDDNETNLRQTKKEKDMIRNQKQRENSR